MKKTSLLILTIATSFCFGFAFKTIITKQKKEPTEMKKVTGIGGIFFTCNPQNTLRDWYQKHLGINLNQYGAVFDRKTHHR